MFSFFGSAGRAEPFKFTSGDGTSNDNVCSIGRFSDRAISILADVWVSDVTKTDDQRTSEDVKKTSPDIERCLTRRNRMTNANSWDKKGRRETMEDRQRRTIDESETKTRREEMI